VFVTEDSIMRGRRPAGPDYVDRVPGSPQAKERLRIIFKTMQGELRLREACQLLGISPQRFHQLREEAIRTAVAGIEPGAPGRPPQTLSPAEQQVRVLEQRLADLEVELQLAKARAEIAVTLPAVAPEPKPEKKKPASSSRSSRRRRRPGREKPT
jgi:transposase-like protein